MISQLAPEDVPIEGPPVHGARPFKEKKNQGKQTAKKTKVAPAQAIREDDNRLYLTVVLEGRSYKALFDPGATCSLIGPALAKRFARHLLPSNSRIRSFSGTISKIAGNLPVLLKIDGREKRINFRAVPSI